MNHQLFNLVEEEICDLSNQLTEDRTFGSLAKTPLTRPELIETIQDQCPVLFSRLGERQIIPVVTALLWSHGYDLVYGRYSVNMKQTTAFMVTKLSDS